LNIFLTSIHAGHANEDPWEVKNHEVMLKREIGLNQNLRRRPTKNLGSAERKAVPTSVEYASCILLQSDANAPFQA
jgi:hypothetical protein